jgi:hypothetical protein
MRLRCLPALALTATALVACSGDDDGADEPSTEPSAAPEGVVSLVATLRPDGVPDGGGEKGASGEAHLEVDAEAAKACGTFTLDGVSEPGAIHVLLAPEGERGPIVTAFAASSAIADREECSDIKPERMAAQLASDPERFAVVVRSGEHRDGAVRGQLEAAD